MVKFKIKKGYVAPSAKRAARELATAVAEQAVGFFEDEGREFWYDVPSKDAVKTDPNAYAVFFIQETYRLMTKHRKQLAESAIDHMEEAVLSNDPYGEGGIDGDDDLF